MKEIFIERYKKAIKEYFDYPGGAGEGHRQRLYVLEEYKKILEEVFGMTHEQVREIYDDIYKTTYM